MVSDVDDAARGWLLDAERRRSVFIGLVEAHHAELVRLAYGICGDADLAADAVQSTWHAAWRQFGQLRDPEAARPWLLSIAANQTRRLARRRRLGRLLELRAYRPPAARAEPGADLDLTTALSKLSPRDRHLVVLRYGMGLTSQEIGVQLGLSAPGVRVRLARVIQALREELSDD